MMQFNPRGGGGGGGGVHAEHKVKHGSVKQVRARETLTDAAILKSRQQDCAHTSNN